MLGYQNIRCYDENWNFIKMNTYFLLNTFEWFSSMLRRQILMHSVKSIVLPHKKLLDSRITRSSGTGSVQWRGLRIRTAAYRQLPWHFLSPFPQDMPNNIHKLSAVISVQVYSCYSWKASLNRFPRPCHAAIWDPIYLNVAARLLFYVYLWSWGWVEWCRCYSLTQAPGPREFWRPQKHARHELELNA